MPCVGDFLVRDSRDGDKDPPPNLVWTEIWGGRYSNIHGNVIPQLLSDRGYVFWDAERLRRTHGGRLCKLLWDKKHRNKHDPRDDYRVDET